MVGKVHSYRSAASEFIYNHWNVSHKLAIITLDETIHPGYRIICQKMKLTEETCEVYFLMIYFDSLSLHLCKMGVNVSQLLWWRRPWSYTIVGTGAGRHLRRQREFVRKNGR